MSDSIPEYYSHPALKSGEENEPGQQADPEGGPGDGNTDSQDAPAEPTVYRADAFRLLRPEGEWQDSSVYAITGPTIDGVTHNITINIDDEVKADSVHDFAAQEFVLVEAQLEKCRMFVDDPVELDCGEPAYPPRA